MRANSSGFKINRRLFFAVTGLAGLVLLALLAGPLLFRTLLPPDVQAGVARHVPILSGWLPTGTPAPTRSYTADTLPTADPKRAATALALLATTDNSPTPTSIASATPTLTFTPTMSPTINLATATPTLPGMAGASVTASPSPSSLPTHTLTPTLVPTASFTPAAPTNVPLPQTLHLANFDWVPQTWNNCGPANLTQVLSFYGLKTTQKETASWLKPNPDAANVSPWQIVTYVNQFTPLRALQRVNGNIDLIRRLLAAHFGVIIETGFSLPNEPNEGWMGHYLTPIGYDDPQEVLFGLDTYLGTGKDHLGIAETYHNLDTRWQQFNRVYIVVYRPERADELRGLLGPDFDWTSNLQNGLEKARREAQADPNNPFAWFNIGTNYVLLHQYKDAAAAYDEARNAGTGLPWRMLWYQFGPFSAYYHIGDYDSAMNLITATFGTTVQVEEIWYWRGMVYAAQGKTQLALRDLNGIMQFNPNYQPAVDAIAAIKAGQNPRPPDIP